MKNVYVYPAVFTAEKSGYSVNFPDLESCYTCGDDLPDALRMAADVLALTLYEYERDHRAIPAPSDRRLIQLAENEFINDISADTAHYQRKFNSKAVKKTLTIPAWLNDLAVTEKINFSQTLQDALAAKLNVQI